MVAPPPGGEGPAAGSGSSDGERAARRAVTIRDVAVAAGVSTATVSRALSGSRSVAPANLRAVRKAADELGYRGDGIARALRRGATQVVAIVVPDITNPFFPHIVQAVELALHRTSHGLLLGDSRNDPAIEEDRIATLLDRRVDGLIVVPSHTSRSARAVAAAARRIPVVQLDRRVEGVDTDFVGVDEAEGIAATTAHLVACGRRRLAYVGADPAISTGRRLAAFGETVARLLPEGPPPVVLQGDFSIQWGEAAGARLVDEAPSVDGVVCGNDLIALGVLRALRVRGAEVPRDVAVTGFDDVGFAAVADPALTTARQPLTALGEHCARLLAGRIAGDDRPRVDVSLATRLVVRASTARTTALSTPDSAEAELAINRGKV